MGSQGDQGRTIFDSLIFQKDFYYELLFYQKGKGLLKGGYKGL